MLRGNLPREPLKPRLRNRDLQDVVSNGGHARFGHPAKQGRRTAPHPNKHIKTGTIMRARRQAEWMRNQEQRAMKTETAATEVLCDIM